MSLEARVPHINTPKYKIMMMIVIIILTRQIIIVSMCERASVCVHVFCFNGKHLSIPEHKANQLI